jgi:4-hydroxy-2-oxoheptanedioate aldolase
MTAVQNLTMRQRIESKAPVLGTVVQSASEAIVEGLGCAGFDFAIMDMEHAAQDISKVENMVRAAQTRRMSTLIRVWRGDPAIVAKAVDTGAEGLVFPSVANREEAERVVSWARLPPLGKRGICPVTRSGGYFTMPLNDYRRITNELVIIVYIETQEGLKNVDEILKVPGLDVVMVGSLDLAVDMQLNMQPWPPKELDAAHERVAAAAKAAGVTLMEFVVAPEQIAASYARGAQIILYGTDTSIMTGASADIVRRSKAVVRKVA